MDVFCFVWKSCPQFNLVNPMSYLNVYLKLGLLVETKASRINTDGKMLMSLFITFCQWLEICQLQSIAPCLVSIHSSSELAKSFEAYIDCKITERASMT